MNDTEKAEAALAIAGNGGANASPEAQFETEQKGELEKARHTADVWAGRAKQLQEEKKALEERIRRLESGQSVEKALKTLTPEDKHDTPDEYLGAAGKVATQLVGAAQAATDEKIAKLQQEMAEREERFFLANIVQQHGAEFFDSISPGGDKYELWERFKKDNIETYRAIRLTHDQRRFGNFVSSFYRELGLPVSGAGTTASPTPSTTGGPSPAGGSGEAQTMTSEQYLAELERAEDMRKAGDMKGWRELNDRLKAALNEGRVK
ncbi:MAG: hypothetical protein J6V72_19790 [Kiritimatiellae bacterium]|nr:hypothetical protein [Kiritimatiellia bacterium]